MLGSGRKIKGSARVGVEVGYLGLEEELIILRDLSNYILTRGKGDCCMVKRASIDLF